MEGFPYGKVCGEQAMLALCGKNVILREFTKANLWDENYRLWLRDLEVVTPLYRMEYLRPLDFKVVEQYVEALLTSEKDCFFAIYDKSLQNFIGTFRLGHIDWRSKVAEIGIMIGDKAYWGKGLATEVLNLGIKYAFTTLSLRKLNGGTPYTNVGMCKCFEKTGFVQEGIKRKELLINGEYVDHIFYGLLKEETTYA